MSLFWKIAILAIIVYCIIGLLVFIFTKDAKKSIFWIAFLLDDIDFPDIDDLGFD